ncbi:hypothetical protein [Pseudomonas sp. 6D_7.1_Bac1]|uniref:hypothetical protein n=1 Tax=Pseudomonas sp. 6D_7.1_Bac1 TaxID=2971615 RepID=UPI0021C6A8B4|nr:hypothetical protein [Pseudomonas sp. 6D_7.1_Bac1]MCU1752135.1 hypothetical protein [Pseudomonas sp. 6D_7.1_Bac1]
MSTFQAFKDDGAILFDTNLICCGLVKSGNMQYIESWLRRTLRSAQLDPNDGANWTRSGATASADWADQLHGFTVYNAVSPIVFIVGKGCYNGTLVSGNATTFYYVNSDPSTKFYCFDLMADNMPGSTFLKTYSDNGRITFNSLQPPLNVIAAIQAPPYQGGQGSQYPPLNSLAYVGGRFVRQQLPVNRLTAQLTFVVDIPIAAGVEFAAFLPWSRGCKILDFPPVGVGRPVYQYDGVEGCAGYVGGITFMFGPAGGTPEAYPIIGPGTPRPPNFYQIAIDRYPVALVINTTNYPFPFN